MKIESIRVQGYHSLEDVTIHPADLRVLVGPNNAGKSNIVDAIDFLFDMYQLGISKAIQDRGGFDRIVHRSAGVFGKHLSFALDLVIRWDEFDAWAYRPEPNGAVPEQADQPDGIRLHHEFVLTGLGEPVVSDVSVTSEAFSMAFVWSDAQFPWLAYTRLGNAVIPDVVDDTKFGQRLFRMLSDGAVQLTKQILTDRIDQRELTWNDLEVIVPWFANVNIGLEQTRLYRLQPGSIRKGAAPSDHAELGKQGTNLPAVIQNLQRTQPEAWSSIENAMYSVAPQIAKITVETTNERQWVLRFEERNGNQWLASEVSDGTIRTLALLVAIFDPRTTLLMIEEPENSVHPWMIRTILEACSETIKQNPDRQILLTTHSPVVIEALEPSEILLVWRDDGSTRLQPVIELDPDLQRLWANGTADLFGMLDNGFIRENVPALAS